MLGVNEMPIIGNYFDIELKKYI